MSLPTVFQGQQQSLYGGLAKWVLFRSACYLGGEGVSFGEPIVPHLAKMLGKSSINVDVVLTPHVDLVDDKLDIIRDGSLDHIFIGPRLEIVPEPEKKLREYVRKLKIGGHLVIAQKINNPDKKALVQFDSNSVRTMVGEVARWKAKDAYERDGVLLQIYRKIEGKKGVEAAKPRAAKRACICRYGAMGDMVIITPLIRTLKEDGFEVTMNISPYALPILEHNPHVTNIVIQEREMIPNQELGAYWDEWKNDYDRYINLSESLEGRFLKVEGRRDFYTSQEWRRKTGEHNYYDYTMRAGGYPDKTGQRGELYFSNAERRGADKFFNKLKGKFIIVWALNGSSFHKVYSGIEVVIGKWLETHPDTIFITVGDRMAKLTEVNHPNLISMAGEWSVRDSMIAACEYADLVIGPETMMTNVAGSMGIPTITLLSHSTHEALCKYWPKDYCLAPDVERAPCYPCFQLHYSRESCPIKQMVSEKGELLAEAPACALDGIHFDRVLARIEEVYSQQFNPGCGIMDQAQNVAG